jgi:hypothetical protein
MCFLMFVPCIIKRSIKNQHNAQIYNAALFHMLASTCFGSSLPSSGSFWIRLSYVKNTHRYGGLSYNVVKWPVCWSVEVQWCKSMHCVGFFLLRYICSYLNPLCTKLIIWEDSSTCHHNKTRTEKG